jgi:putative transposase
MRVQKLVVRSPNLNAYVERFIQSIQQECLDKFIGFSADHLDHLVNEYVEYYHYERPHQNKGNAPLLVSGESLPHEVGAEGVLKCRERLGGVLMHYYREAA